MQALVCRPVLIPKLESSYFDWLTWRNGSPLDAFGIQCRTYDLINSRKVLQEHAVGWCLGESLPCRPKANHVAVMFFKNGRHFWFHLRLEEAAAIFDIAT